MSEKHSCIERHDRIKKHIRAFAKDENGDTDLNFVFPVACISGIFVLTYGILQKTMPGAEKIFAVVTGFLVAFVFCIACIRFLHDMSSGLSDHHPDGQPNLPWIPCSGSSEFPKDIPLWVTHDNGVDDRYVGKAYWDMTEWNDNMSDVVAYMPYYEPDPYRGPKLEEKTEETVNG